MDQALVIGSSGGIGAAVANDLTRRGYAVARLSRSGDGLDVTDESRVEAVLGRFERGQFRLVFVATGALGVPEKSLSHLRAEAMASQFVVNTIGPSLVLKHARRLMPCDRPAHFAALSARVGSIGDNRLGGWYSYRASKAALNQILHGAAIEMARSHPQLVVTALHPGTVDTAFTADYPHDKLPPDEAAHRLIDVLLALDPSQTGGFHDHAGKEIVW